MRATPILLVALMTSLSACTSMPSDPLMVPPPVDSACLTPCQNLPEPSEQDAVGFQAWVHELVHSAGQCIRLHARCVRASK